MAPSAMKQKRPAESFKPCDDRPGARDRVLSCRVLTRTTDDLPALLVSATGLQAEAVAVVHDVDAVGPVARVDAVKYFLVALVFGH